MSEQASGDDLFSAYSDLMARRQQLGRIVPADATIEKAITAGIAAVDHKMAQLSENPSLADQVLGRLDSSAMALEQLSSLQGVLEAEELTATTAPYESTARQSLEIAAALELSEDRAQRLTGLRQRLGALLMGEETVIAVEDSTLPEVRNEVAAVIDGVVAADNFSEVITEATTHPDVDLLPDQLLPKHFSVHDAQVLVEFLIIARDIIRAHQIPAMNIEELKDLYADILNSQPEQKERNIEELKQERTAVIERLTTLMGEEELLDRVLGCLDEEDPRMALLDYLFMTVNDTQRRQLRHMATLEGRSHSDLLGLLDDHHYRDGVLGIIQGQVERQRRILHEASDRQRSAEAADLEAARQQLLEDFAAQAELLRKKIPRGFDRTARHSPQVLSRALSVPLPKVLMSVLAANEAGLFDGSEDVDAGAVSTAGDLLTVNECITAQLYAMPRFANLIIDNREVADMLVRKGEKGLDPESD